MTLSDTEYVRIHAAATRAGIADASGLAEAGVQLATQPRPDGPPPAWGKAMQTLMTVRGELEQDRRVLRNVGGNLNDLARQANTEHALATYTGDVLAMVERAVARIAETVEALDEQVAVARAAKLAGAE